MYTESFAGDIDALLEREYNIMAVESYYASKAAIKPHGEFVVTLPIAVGKPDRYGLTKGQREALTAAILESVRGLYDTTWETATFHIDKERKIVVHGWWQAANLYQRLTHNDLYAGLAGGKAKISVKVWQH